MSQATTFADLAAEAQRQTLSALEQAQGLALRGAELATLRIPVPRDVNVSAAIEGVFGFAGQMLEQQKAYALRMTEILSGGAERAQAKSK